MKTPPVLTFGHPPPVMPRNVYRVSRELGQKIESLPISPIDRAELLELIAEFVESHELSEAENDY